MCSPASTPGGGTVLAHAGRLCLSTLQQTQPSADDLAGTLVTPRSDEAGNQIAELGRQCDVKTVVGGHAVLQIGCGKGDTLTTCYEETSTGIPA